MELVESIEIDESTVEYIKTDFGKIEQDFAELKYSDLFYVDGRKFK